MLFWASMLCLATMSLHAQPLSESQSTNFFAFSEDPNPSMVTEGNAGNQTEENLNSEMFTDCIEDLPTRELINPQTMPLLSDSNMYQQGILDARRLYPARNTGAGGTLFTSLILDPVLGLVPAIICSSHPPKTSNLGVENADLLYNEEYMKGYTEEAHKIKKKKVWIGYGAGSAAYFAIIGIYFASINN